jgi:hypothetical protein
MSVIPSVFFACRHKLSQTSGRRIEIKRLLDYFQIAPCLLRCTRLRLWLSMSSCALSLSMIFFVMNLSSHSS